MLKQTLEQGQALTGAALARLLPGATQRPTSIHQAMRHSVFAGGKRLRPVLCLEAGRTVAGSFPKGIEDLGAAAIMIAPSKQPVPNGDAVFTYYARIAEKSTLPIVLQDHPASTEVHMSAALILRIAREIPTCVCISPAHPSWCAAEHGPYEASRLR
jgi:dihydrodipicolinate synthase/N-acetylneuraminate lyase